MRYGAVHLDELETLAGPGSLTWRPVRAHFGIRAFGCNAYSAAEPGADVVEPHDEDPELGHEELYFVARGHARFTLDGEEIDAPAGTYVFVGDPRVHRHAVAREAGTTVLSFGGPPAFTPSAWEWSFRARPLIDEHPERARETLREGFALHPESPSLFWALAQLEAAEGRREEALSAARRALELEPEIAEELRADPRLAPIRDAL